ncbi:hypothetical protein RUM43_008224 [Polyplax serrata]|uniref:RUN domain-containing protein n=1 Tax=Polyplax serrata TaxID=468196 RepID=A0AAN8S8A8_POLSC
MQSFTRRKKVQETEILIKESLLRQLSYSIKEIQLSHSQQNEVFSTTEGCNSLVVTLEAIFLHGLKRGFLRSALKTMSSSEETKPQPSFWNMVTNYTHRDTINRIKKLSQITTDVGRCRVWIRMALNEAELTSYITAMEKDRRSLNSYYSVQAFLRDRETCDTACKFLEGILAMQFEFPINSSILNIWSSEPLMLSGLWAPPMKTPLSSGVDVAERIEDDDYEDDTSSIKTSSSITTLSTILALDETQALKIILETPFRKINKDPNSSPLVSPPQCAIKHEFDEPITEEVKVNQDVTDEALEESTDKDVSRARGNSLVHASGWSSTNEISSTAVQTTSKPNVIESEKDPKTEEYSSLLEKVGISSTNKINYEDKLKAMMEKQGRLEGTASPTISGQDSNYWSYTSKLYKIVREVGLKAQKYTCAGCQMSIGLTFGEARLCYFTGEHYCCNCHLNEMSVIPSRIIFNWDHKKYPVCTNAAKYLTDICNRLLIDVKGINPKLYGAVKEMKDLRKVRVQLNMLRAYLFTCKESLLPELQKKVAPREYFYEFIDHYSVNDLCRVPGGGLATDLAPIVAFGRHHVVSCGLCSQKGFICEICKNSQVIYPFDISSTYRCSHCFAIYHDTCLTSHKNCPKCLRIKSRSQQVAVNAPKESAQS